MSPQLKNASEIALSTGIALTILGILYAPLSLGGVLLLGPGAWKIGLLILSTLVVWINLPYLLGSERVKLEFNPFPCLIAFWILILSDYSERNFGYFAHP